MAQLFHPAWNVLSKASVLAALLLVAMVGGIAATVVRSGLITGQERQHVQPIAFGHQHHVGLVGIDCRYCHVTVETSPYAGIPATEICMNCHTEIWKNEELLAPVRESLATGEPLRWRRVHNLADFVYFDHGIHIAKGVGCVSCHGQIDKMPVTFQAEPLTMVWCLDCHRDPQPHLRPADAVFNPSWAPPSDIEEIQAELMIANDVQSKTSCSDCHR